jgi:hypothetical protein
MRPTTNSIFALAFSSLCAFLIPLACTDDGGATDAGTEGEGECVPGQSVACSCDEGGGTGAMTCEPDGSGFGVCMCTFGDGDGDPTTGDGDGEPGDGDGDEWDGVSVPSWSMHIVPFLYSSCGAGVDGCHSRTAYHAAVDSDCRGWLSLEDAPLGAAYYGGDNDGQPTGCPDMLLSERLSQLAPWQCAPDSAYVVPNDLAGSYIWDKIQGTNLCDLSPGMPSDQMPPPETMIVLTDMQKDMIEAWILGGAPYDN